MSTLNSAQKAEKIPQKALFNIETTSKNENVNTCSSLFSTIFSSVLALRNSVKQRQKKEQEKLRDSTVLESFLGPSPHLTSNR